MKTKEVLCLLSFVAAASISYGSVIFQSDGVKSTWSNVIANNGGQVSQVSSPTYNGDGKAIKHYGPSGQALNVHAEVAQDPCGNNGDNRYYGWAFMLGSDFPSSLSKGSALCQLTGHGSCGFGQNDFVMIKGTSFVDQTAGGNSCSPTKATHTIVSSIPSRNVWHRLVIHKLWKGGTTGALGIWLDGSQKVSVSNIATGWSDATSAYAWHCGVYAGFASGETGSRTVWTDHARIASTYTEANPSSW